MMMMILFYSEDVKIVFLVNPSGLNKPECDHCSDNPKRKCKFCACCVCGDKRDPDRQLMCDECDAAYHLECLSPPLDEIPDVEEWSVSTWSPRTFLQLVS